MKNDNSEYKNLDERQKNCLALIESLGIYELRAVARVFGDNSPTTLKRNDHIKIIMDKIISGEELRPLPLRQGRPFKELSNIEGILTELSAISGKDYKPKSVSAITAMPSNVISFHQADDSILRQRLMPIDARGVLKEKSISEYYFKNLENGTMVLVKKDLDTRLQADDYVTGSAILMNDKGDYVLERIKTINFRTDKLYVNTFSCPEKVSPTEKFDFGGQEILLGGRYVVKASHFCDEEEKLKDILKKLNEENVATLALIPNVLSEQQSCIKGLGFNTPFLIGYEEQPQNAYETITAFLDCIKRLQSQNLRLAVFVEDIPTIANIIDSRNKNFQAFSEQSTSIIKQFMLLANADKSGASTTIFVSQDEADLFNPTYVSSIYKIAKKINF